MPPKKSPNYGILPPKNMPLEFIYQNKQYHWYSGLKREKKSEMIRVFNQIQQKGIFLGFQQLRDKISTNQPVLEKDILQIRTRVQLINDLEYKLLKTFLAILNQNSINWDPYQNKFPYIPLCEEDSGISSQSISSEIEFIEVFQWDERSGPSRLGSYPSNKKTPLKDMMQIYANHIAEVEPGFLALSNPDRTIMSYYAGPASRLFLIVQIIGVQDVVQYELKVEKIMQKIVALVPKGEDAQKTQVEPKLEGFYHEFSSNKPEPIAENLKNVMNHKILKLLYSKLQQDGLITSDNLKDWLKAAIQKGMIDLEKDLKILYDFGLIQRRFVGNTIIFGLIKDIVSVLTPPFVFLKNLPKLSLNPQILTQYLQIITEQIPNKMGDNNNYSLAAEMLMKPAAINLLKYLSSNYLQANHYSHLNALGIENPTQIIQEFIDANFLIAIDFQSEKYYLPLVEVGFLIFSPEYLYPLLLDKIQNNSPLLPQIYGYLCMLTEENPFILLK